MIFWFKNFNHLTDLQLFLKIANILLFSLRDWLSIKIIHFKPLKYKLKFNLQIPNLKFFEL